MNSNNMKKLLTLLFLFTILYSPYSHSNILDNFLGNMSTSDVMLYDKSWTEVGPTEIETKLGYASTSVNLKAKLKNLNQDKSIKGVWITIETFDCKKGCKNCITANIATYNVLEENNPFTGKTHNTLRPNNTFQVNFNFEDATLKRTYVQASGNVTCYASSIDKVKGFHVFE